MPSVRALPALVLCLPAGVLLFAQQPSPELQRAAEEFRIETRNQGLRADSPARARQVHAQQAKFHGRVFENFRNDFLDALPHEVAQRGGEKSLLRRNQFGFNLSGPVIVPKLYPAGRATFFSLSYEGMRERIGRSYLRTVPLLAERSGDYTDVVDAAGAPLAVYDPLTTRLNPNFNPAQPVTPGNLQYVRETFPGNRMPAARLDPVARKALAYYPAPNANAGPYWRNNYFIVSPETNHADGMIGKVDHTLDDKRRLAFSFSFTNGLAAPARFYHTAADPAPADRVYHNRRAGFDHVFTASPRAVNTLSFEAATDQNVNSSPAGEYPRELGLAGVAGKTFPRFGLGPYLSIGRSNPDTRNVRNSFVLTDAQSLRRGKHNLRLVGQVIRQQVNSYTPASPSGAFNFSDGLTSLPGVVNTGHPFASFLLGLPDYVTVSLVPAPSYFRNSTAVAALQDNYEHHPGLNFSAGVRMELDTPRTEKYNRQSTVDLSVINPENDRPGALIAAGVAGIGRSFQPVTVRFSPNASLAWSLDANRRQVLRLSYGMSFQSVPIYSAQWGTQAFNGTQVLYGNNSQLDPALLLSGGVPAPRALPDTRREAANNTNAELVNRDGVLPRYQSVGVSYERQLPAALVVTASFGVAWGKNLFLSGNTVNLNALPHSALRYRDRLNDETFNRSQRPYPQYLGFNLYSSWPAGHYRREAFGVRVEKRMSQGLSLNTYYEMSRQWDDYSGPGLQNFFDRRAEWALCAWNAPQRLSLNLQYEFPIGSNQPYLNYSDWRRHLTDGWSVSAISSVSAGEPLILRPQFNNTGGVVNTLYVNTVPGVDPHVPNPSPELWFNPEAFSHPADFTLGDAPRTHPTLRNPVNQNHDLSLSKRFTLDPERTVEFSAAGFNFLNHANWNDPDTMIGPAGAPNTNTGKIIGSRGGRVVQLGLRFSF